MPTRQHPRIGLAAPTLTSLLLGALSGACSLATGGTLASNTAGDSSIGTGTADGGDGDPESMDAAGAEQTGDDAAAAPDATAYGDAQTGDRDGSSKPTGEAGSPASPQCANLVPAPTFCDDFDEGSTTLGSTIWDMSSDPGAFSLVPGSTVSPPDAVLYALPALAAQATGSDFITHSFPVCPETTRVDVDIYPVALDSQTPTAILAFGITTGSLWTIEVRVGPSSAELVQRDFMGSTATQLMPTGVRAGTWTHLTLNANFTTMVASLSIGATTPLSGIALTAPSPASAQGLVALGRYMATGPLAATSVMFDNLVVRNTP